MLTPRQLDVLGLVARGCDQRRTAELLGIQEHTVKKHIEHAKKRLGAKNRAHAVWIALCEGWIVP